MMSHRHRGRLSHAGQADPLTIHDEPIPLNTNYIHRKREGHKGGQARGTGHRRIESHCATSLQTNSADHAVWNPLQHNIIACISNIGRRRMPLFPRLRMVRYSEFRCAAEQFICAQRMVVNSIKEWSFWQRLANCVAGHFGGSQQTSATINRSLTRGVRIPSELSRPAVRQAEFSQTGSSKGLHNSALSSQVRGHFWPRTDNWVLRQQTSSRSSSRRIVAGQRPTRGQGASPAGNQTRQQSCCGTTDFTNRPELDTNSDTNRAEFRFETTEFTTQGEWYE